MKSNPFSSLDQRIGDTRAFSAPGRMNAHFITTVVSLPRFTFRTRHLDYGKNSHKKYILLSKIVELFFFFY